jgi:hypothetical protein
MSQIYSQVGERFICKDNKFLLLRKSRVSHGSYQGRAIEGCAIHLVTWDHLVNNSLGQSHLRPLSDQHFIEQVTGSHQLNFIFPADPQQWLCWRFIPDYKSRVREARIVNP